MLTDELHHDEQGEEAKEKEETNDASKRDCAD